METKITDHATPTMIDDLEPHDPLRTMIVDLGIRVITHTDHPSRRAVTSRTRPRLVELARQAPKR